MGFKFQAGDMAPIQVKIWRTASPECMEKADDTLLASMMNANSGQLLACDTICLYFLVIIPNLYEDLPSGNPLTRQYLLLSLPSTLLRKKLPVTQKNTNKTEPQRPSNQPLILLWWGVASSFYGWMSLWWGRSLHDNQ